MIDEFQKHGLQLANKVDLVVSRWSFRHLADPVGTFIQAYDLLRPKKGYFLFDGFYFLYDKQRMDNPDKMNNQMIRLCLNTSASFLTRYFDCCRSLDHFILNKPDDRPCHIKKQYLGIQIISDGFQVGSETVTRFKDLEESIDLIEGRDDRKNFLWTDAYRGDKNLYEKLRQNRLITQAAWKPLQDKDVHRKNTTFHIAIASGKEKNIYRYLQKGCDINESDDKGATPLHLAIEHSNYKLFSLLLEKGALLKLFAYNRGTPLHLAMRYDFKGHFISALIAAGADINIFETRFLGYTRTPLDDAIKSKNVKAVELLLEHKVIVRNKKP